MTDTQVNRNGPGERAEYNCRPEYDWQDEVKPNMSTFKPIPERYRAEWFASLHRALEWANAQAANGFRLLTLDHDGQNDPSYFVVMEDREASIKARGMFVEPIEAKPVGWR